MHEALIVFIVIGLPVSWAVLAAVTLSVRLRRCTSTDRRDFQTVAAAGNNGRRS